MNRALGLLLIGALGCSTPPVPDCERPGVGAYGHYSHVESPDRDGGIPGGCGKACPTESPRDRLSVCYTDTFAGPLLIWCDFDCVQPDAGGSE